MAQQHIIVVGAGVTGLTAANLLQRHIPSAKITIVAAETPIMPHPTPDYASMWAGAHYRPIHPLSTPQLRTEHNMAISTAKIMHQIAQDHPEAGVESMEGVDYWSGEPPEELLGYQTGETVYAGEEDGFRVLEKNELPKHASWGCRYRSYGVNVGVYCRWLLKRFLDNGGQIVMEKLAKADDAFDVVAKDKMNKFGPATLVVNCSGRNFDMDPKVKIIRGQTVLVKQKYHKTITGQNKDGSWSFLIPRPCNGGTIVGGTKEPGDWEAKPREETRRRLFEMAIEAYPDLAKSVNDFEVIKDNVGRRPWREGGYRFETQRFGPNKTIVHGYGAGGRGYELSWAAGHRVLGLVQEALAVKSKL
jgi:D-amino-acid oxidase